jgi:CheY-like chemotaxis protein
VRAKVISVRVLLVSGDIRTIDTLCDCMEQMAMHVEVCSDMDSAIRRLCHGKFEAVVVDFKDPAENLELIKQTREMTSHKGAVVLAILNSSNEMPDAFRAGANFALVRPLIPAILVRTLKAAYPLMVLERRRYCRCPVQNPIHLSSISRPEFMATSINVSEGGMAFSSSIQLQVGETINLKITLPGTERPATISGEVCWTDNAGRMGLEFIRLPAPAAESLKSWIADRLEEWQPC